MVNRAFAGMVVAAFLSGVVFGQSSETRPAFEMADVHVSPHSASPQMTGGILRAGRYELRKASMVDLIKTAYGIDADSVVGDRVGLNRIGLTLLRERPARR